MSMGSALTQVSDMTQMLRRTIQMIPRPRSNQTGTLPRKLNLNSTRDDAVDKNFSRQLRWQRYRPSEAVSAFCQVCFLECGADATRQFQCIIIGPKVHEEQAR